MSGDTKVAYKSISHPFLRPRPPREPVSRLSPLPSGVFSRLCAHVPIMLVLLYIHDVHSTWTSSPFRARRDATQLDVVEKERRKSRPGIRRNTYAIPSSQTIYLEKEEPRAFVFARRSDRFLHSSIAAFNASCLSVILARRLQEEDCKKRSQTVYKRW